MSKRSDVIGLKPGPVPKYGLIYTKKCGWIDLGHANPAGSLQLWQDLKKGALSAKGKGTFPVAYRQSMRKFGLVAGAGQAYEVNAKLSESDLRRVALAIFLEVSVKFESLQSGWLFSKLTDSGFSSEDLISDLLGFYRAVDPSTDYIALCEPTSADYALKIWDKFGPVGSTKLHGFGMYLHAIDERTGLGSSVCAMLPRFLSTISPAPMGEAYFQYFEP